MSSFTGLTGSKPRPAVVVSAEAFHARSADLIVCPISSQPRSFSRPGVGHVPLKHWPAIGLRHPSTARLSNLVAVEKTIIKRFHGVMPDEDFARIEDGLRDAFGL